MASSVFRRVSATLLLIVPLVASAQSVSSLPTAQAAQARVSPPIARASVPAAALLQGSVVDENNLPVPEALVTIRRAVAGPVLFKVMTDDAGHFKLGPLPAGEYFVDIEKQAFFRLAASPTTIVAGVNQASYTLAHEQELHQKVDVVSTANPIQPEETTRRETLVQHEIRDLPFTVSHDLRSALPALPGVTLDNNAQVHVAGARVDETEYLLDGFEISNAATGGLTSQLNVDAVRSINVESGRYGAQNANAGAAVLALETQQGDDQWRFGTTNFLPSARLEKGFHFGNWYPRFTLAGPLHRGHAWVSDALGLQHTLEIVRERPKGADTATVWHADNLLRAQVNLTPQQALQGSLLTNVDHDNHRGLSPLSPISTTTHLTSDFIFVSLKDQVMFGSKLLELGFAGDRGNVAVTPLGKALYVLTANGATGNYFATFRNHTHRWQTLGNLYIPSREWHGTHDFAMGGNLAWIRYTHFANRGPFAVAQPNGVITQRTSFLGSPQYNELTALRGVYAQDTWQLSHRLRVEPGMRVDWDRIVHGPLPGPRIALNYLPFAGDWAKLSAGWGIYYQPVNLAIRGQSLDQERSDSFYDDAGNLTLGPVFTRFIAPLRGLKAPRFRTASLGWQEQIGLNSVAGVQLLRRVEADGLAYENLIAAPCSTGACGSQGALFLLQNNRSDHYKSIDFSFRHSFSDQAGFFADYMWSHAQTNRALDYVLESAVFSSQAAGALSWDAPNRFLSWGYAPSHIWDVTVSYFAEYRTGYPFSIIDGNHQLVGLPNRMRFPTYANLNLGFEKRVPFHGHQWALRLAVINATGRFNPTSVNNNTSSPQFLQYAASQGRAFTGRLRLVTK